MEKLFTAEKSTLKSWRNGETFEVYTVYLPHSCDEWVITEEKVKQDAIDSLQDFIRQAEEALETLKKL